MSDFKKGDSVKDKTEGYTGKVIGLQGDGKRVMVEWEKHPNIASAWVEPSDISKASK